jgi:hypothetical protein
MKNKYKHFVIIAFITIIGLSIVGCSGVNRLSGKWEGKRSISYFPWNVTVEYAFSGKKFTLNEYKISGYGIELGDNKEGTYSISKNNIELKFSDGDIEVYSFSRTKNTLNIGEIQFTRKN